MLGIRKGFLRFFLVRHNFSSKIRRFLFLKQGLGNAPDAQVLRIRSILFSKAAKSGKYFRNPLKSAKFFPRFTEI
jgi:hypothetical protein